MRADLAPSTPLVVADEGELRGIVSAALKGGSPVWIRATGTSMEPTIPAGSLVRVSALAVPPKRGDVVLALPTDGIAAVHRVRRIEGDNVVTIGDNRLVEDRPVAAAAIAGIVDEMREGARTGPVRSGMRQWFLVELRRALRRVKASLARALPFVSRSRED